MGFTAVQNALKYIERRKNAFPTGDGTLLSLTNLTLFATVFVSDRPPLSPPDLCVAWWWWMFFVYRGRGVPDEHGGGQVQEPALHAAARCA